MLLLSLPLIPVLILHFHYYVLVHALAQSGGANLQFDAGVLCLYWRVKFSVERLLDAALISINTAVVTLVWQHIHFDRAIQILFTD